MLAGRRCTVLDLDGGRRNKEMSVGNLLLTVFTSLTCHRYPGSPHGLEGLCERRLVLEGDDVCSRKGIGMGLRLHVVHREVWTRGIYVDQEAKSR